MTPRLGRRSAIDLGSVFAGRIGGILVNLIFIPWYDALLDSRQFGAVALILSFQAFFLMSDLGLATVLARDTAAAAGRPEPLAAARQDRRRAELIIAALIVATGAVAVGVPAISSLWDSGTGITVALAALLIGTLVLLNIIQLCLNAVHRYVAGNALAVGGALVRSAATVAALLAWGADLHIFLAAQVAVSFAHLLVARTLLDRPAQPTLASAEALLDRVAMRRLMRRCLPVMLYTLAGAAALNLDKSIVSAFISLETAGLYFLAATYALVPVAILSGPISQYFAPHVVKAEAEAEADPSRRGRIGALYQLLLMGSIVVPAANLALHAETWIGLWLPHQSAIDDIALLASILIGGTAIGATGYYATSYLIAVEDHHFLARLGAVAAIAVLLAAMLLAAEQSLVGIAIAYAAFHGLGWAALWARIARLWGGRIALAFLARYHLLPAGAMMAAVGIAELAVIPIADPVWRAAAALALSLALSAAAACAIGISGRASTGAGTA